MQFSDLGLRPELEHALGALGYEEPTPIQEQAIPPLLEGRDLVGQAATGTGKTAAFALPLLHRLPAERGKRPSALVLAPTRELAVQVSGAIARYGSGVGARVLTVYGGQPIGGQLKALHQGVDVVVGTPGRVVDHLDRGSLALTDLQVVVLDEADEMFDMGFADDIEAILKACPRERQTVLFSATMPPKIDKMSRRHLTDPVRISIAREKAPVGEAPRVRQVAHVVPRASKPAALGRVLDLESPAAAIVFCRTREEVDSLTEHLGSRGYRAEPLHGGMSQDQRDRVMQRLRGGTANLLIATDVAARGLDVDHLTHVVNYNVPSAPEAYVHRVGRVGRAGREGVAITLTEPREQRMLQAIEKVLGAKVPVTPLPTTADLEARRLASTRTALVEALATDLTLGRELVQELSAEHGPDQVAAAAALLAHRTLHPPVEEIPEPPARPVREDVPRRAPEPSSRTGPKPGKARVWIGAGRAAGIRPQDLVGAICNETGLKGKDIGGIDIAERFALVEVPEVRADEVIKALRASVIKGRKVQVRRDRDAAGGEAQRSPARGSKPSSGPGSHPSSASASRRTRP
jgi:ATP-dependent RNA helicase DeaD